MSLIRKYAFGVIAVCTVLFVPAGRAEAQADIVFWNLENFFDYFDDGGSSSDADFSSRGSRRWTKARFTKKCNMVGKTLLWMGENCCADGEPPAVVGVAEVENAFVLNRLVNSPVLKKLNYGYVHYDSPDRRGIDVALLYRRDVVRVLSSRPVHIYGDGGVLMRTRDILYVYAEYLSGPRGSGFVSAGVPDNNVATGDSLKPPRIHLLVNHHPSKFSGAKASMRARELAMTALRDVCDSIMRVSDAPIVAMGDFNDTPDGRQFILLDGRLKNLAEPLCENGEGSIRYEGRWELIDHFLVGYKPLSGCRHDDMYEGAAENAPGRSIGGDGGNFKMSVIHVPFLMTEDRTHTGFKPMRTYVGPRYAGGVSDHCPILLEFSM